ncbi:DUF4296 domain-containing protein [uncultured Duncaniella sp.]|uniref:DUF4296 domain-containing protein n=1 Tax=uncultured Duncaniella sp. TaxID=2768039 RepID=UPI002677535F|nr:DUF4296 domain-containing protein [uncultured Duncaniella sp.]MCI9172491.1 DUF4296 domain-containing protein [Muribaculaceae bacterium]
MRRLPVITLLLLMLAACSKTPDYVISEDRMASLMADLYMGDAVVENDNRSYRNDSVRKVLIQSVYAKHGVTRHDVDTSLQWYGHNMQAYMDMCNLTEEILQKRIDEAERAGGKTDKAPRRTSMDGDSVDVWTGIRSRRNGVDIPSDFISFNLSTDKNWDRGDRYTLSVKGMNTRTPITMNLAVDYNDGTTEYKWYRSTGDEMSRLLLVLDSAKVASTVYGTIHYAALPGEVSYLDSITLVRTRGRNDNVAARQGQHVVRYR